MTEAHEQIAVVEYCRYRHIPVFHIPNEGKRSPKSGAYLRKLGMESGIPDLCIPVARGQYHSLYIEMKAKGGRITDRQKLWIKQLQSEGMCACVCYGADNAITLIDSYMAQSSPNRP